MDLPSEQAIRSKLIECGVRNNDYYNVRDRAKRLARKEEAVAREGKAKRRTQKTSRVGDLRVKESTLEDLLGSED